MAGPIPLDCVYPCQAQILIAGWPGRAHGFNNDPYTQQGKSQKGLTGPLPKQGCRLDRTSP